MAIALLFTVLFALSGLCISTFLFQKHRLVIRIWFGLVLGLLFLTWIPSLLAFLIGFTRTAQLFALGIMVLLAILSLVVSYRKYGSNCVFHGFLSRDLGFLWVFIPLFLLGSIILSTHILKPLESGGVAVGQVTYGDLAMHLGFISSIAEQGVFPPEYSIFPGHIVNYPFLCETSASSLLLLGANIRQAYLISALYAYCLVLMGVWFFFRSWLKKNMRAHIATLLFFLGGGFGFIYFFDLAKHAASLNTLLDGNYFSNFSWLLDGFYDTPTNLPDLGLRWVNPIVDMLIPQRATLFGWAFLFPCLYLLLGFFIERKEENIIPLGLIAGSLPLIHTHSFLALGIISAVFCITDLVFHFNKRRLLFWGIYAGMACILGAPQLFGFAFQQASESHMVQLHWNWANEADSYIWFYIKNLGWIFLLMPVAFFALGKKDRKIYSASIVLWILAEIMVFQPNNYDNNKLLFVWFAFTCGLVTKFLHQAYLRCRLWIHRHSAHPEQSFALLSCALGLMVLLLISFVIVSLKDGAIAWYTICTLLFLIGLCVYLILRAAPLLQPGSQILVTISACFCGYPALELLYILWRGYAQTTLQLNTRMMIVMLIFYTVSIILVLFVLLRQRIPGRFSAAYASVSMHLVVYMLTLTLTLSSVMTILRELKSEYQVYSASDLETVDFIKTQTESDSLFLANSYHWNLITPLTGRSIVTGTSTFLYFHGINNTQREIDVRMMYENPAENIHLFKEYGIDYILFSSAERYNYDCDESFFQEHGTIIFDNPSATIYQLQTENGV